MNSLSCVLVGSVPAANHHVGHPLAAHNESSSSVAPGDAADPCHPGSGSPGRLPRGAGCIGPAFHYTRQARTRAVAGREWLAVQAVDTTLDQFIIPAYKLIFPFSFIVGKVAGLVATLVMVFDVWRGIRAGDDARLAGEREVSVYRDLDI